MKRFLGLNRQTPFVDIKTRAKSRVAEKRVVIMMMMTMVMVVVVVSVLMMTVNGAGVPHGIRAGCVTHVNEEQRLFFINYLALCVGVCASFTI